MKLILFSGTHPRHLFVNKVLLNLFEEILIIVMERENLLLDPPNNLVLKDKKLFLRHFQNRFEKELKYFGNLDAKLIFKNHNVIFVKPSELNSIELMQNIVSFEPDFSFIFGTDLIKNPVLSVLPKNTINLHLGLSPWYRGSATLFWPFVFLQPQFAGITFHKIIEKPDAGQIIHQNVPKLSKDDTIHDVAIKCVIQARIDIKKIVNFWKINQQLNGKNQKISGRVWREKDFHPSHLRIIYNLFNDDIVNKYLEGELNQEKPNLFSCIN